MSSRPKWQRDRARDARNRSCQYCAIPLRTGCAPACPRYWRAVTSADQVTDTRRAILAWVASQSDGVPLAWSGLPADPRSREYRAAEWAAEANAGLSALAVSRGWEPA